jgi:hypothetical protein
VSAQELLDEVLEAHGGLDRWRAAASLEAKIRSGGLLLRTRVPGTRFAAYRAEVAVAEPRVVFDPFPREGQRGVYEHRRARIEDKSGRTVAEREDPRVAFSGLSGLRRNLRWDALDATYFAGYAIWNYFTTPLLLTRGGIELSDGEPWSEDGETWRRLDAVFPPQIDTHSARQSFYVDAEGRIRRHDYTAEVVGRWARAAQMLADHRSFDGLLFPTSRWVRPVGPGGRPLRLPTLVWIDVTSVSVRRE